MAAGVLVRRPQKLWAPCLASSMRSVIIWRDEHGGAAGGLGGGGHDGPVADNPAAQVRFHGQAEAVEPLGVGGVAAEPGGQAVAQPGPAVRAADPGRVLDRQGRCGNR
jgi:hypothetical protein